MTEVPKPKTAINAMQDDGDRTDNTSGRIGIIISNFDSPYYGQVVDGASEVLLQNGYTTLVHSSGKWSFGEKASWDALMRSRCEGIIFYAKALPEQQLLELLQENPKWVLINRCISGFEKRCVYLDNAKGTQLAAQHLIENGHTEVAMITGPQQYPESVLRTEGFIQELAKHDVRIAKELIVDGDFTIEGGVEAFRELLQTDRPFTALFCQNDEIAAGVVDVCRQEGISVPSELSIIGFDDTRIASIISPALTTISQPISGSGVRAAQIVLSLLEEPEHIIDFPEDYGKLTPHLVVRDSVADRRVTSDTPPNRLTPRESECMQWIAAGKTSCEIATILSISESTINFHLKNVIAKLNANNRTHAVALALSQGLINPM